jgi:prepilin-type processing-associated H-X9-DG protein
MDTRTNHLADLYNIALLPQFQCPEEVDFYKVLLLHPRDTNSAVISGGRAITSYTSNTALCGYDNGYGAAGDTRLVQTPSSVMLVVDAQATSNWNWNVIGAPTSPNIDLGELLSDGTYGPRIPYNRHQAQLVVSYVDGHVSPVAMEGLNEVGVSQGVKIH